MWDSQKPQIGQHLAPKQTQLVGQTRLQSPITRGPEARCVDDMRVGAVDAVGVLAADDNEAFVAAFGDETDHRDAVT